MNQHVENIVNGLWLLLAVCAVMWACVRGCAIMNNPETIKADSDARMRYAEFAKPSPSPSVSP